MTEPIVEQIAQKMAAAVNEIKLASGWKQDLTCVRPTRLGFEGDATPKDGLVVMAVGDRELDPDNSTQGNPPKQAWVQPFVFVCFIIASDASTDPIDTRIQRAGADVEKRLMQNQRWDGLAINTVILPPQRFNDGPGATGIAIMAAVSYRTPQDDPYVAG